MHRESFDRNSSDEGWNVTSVVREVIARDAIHASHDGATLIQHGTTYDTPIIKLPLRGAVHVTVFTASIETSSGLRATYCGDAVPPFTKVMDCVRYDAPGMVMAVTATVRVVMLSPAAHVRTGLLPYSNPGTADSVRVSDVPTTGTAASVTVMVRAGPWGYTSDVDPTAATPTTALTTTVTGAGALMTSVPPNTVNDKVVVPTIQFPEKVMF